MAMLAPENEQSNKQYLYILKYISSNIHQPLMHQATSASGDSGETETHPSMPSETSPEGPTIADPMLAT